MSKEKEMTIAPLTSVDKALNTERNTRRGLYKSFTPEKGKAVESIISLSTNDLFSVIDKPRCKKNDLPTIKERTHEYLQNCSDRQWLPSVDGWSISLGIGRQTLYDWLDDTRNREVYEFLNLVRYAFADMNATAAANGLTNVIAFIFGAKNFFGYTDKNEVVLMPKASPLGEEKSPEELQRKYIEVVSAGDSENE